MYCENADLTYFTNCQNAAQVKDTATSSSTSTTTSTSCTCKQGYTQFQDSSASKVHCALHGYTFDCGSEPDASTVTTACHCKGGYSEYTGPEYPYTLCSANGHGYECGAEPALDSSVGTFTSAVATSVDTTAITNRGNDSQGLQLKAASDAKATADLGADQAANVGAVMCAQGANANLTDPQEAAGFYASCRQNFEAAKAMSGRDGGYNPAANIADGAAGREALADFEKNFGVSPKDYLSQMLGKGGGPASLSELLEGKLPGAKLKEAMDAAEKISPTAVSQDPAKFAVDFGAAKKTSAGFRENLKKKLEKPDERATTRAIASGNENHPRRGADKIGDKEHLEPLRADPIFNTEEERELTIFQVVHLKYEKLAVRMHR
jgi:hypothetical protein